MAKKKAARPKSARAEMEQKWRGSDNIRAATSSFLADCMDQAQRKDGSLEACAAGVADKLIMGVRFPALVLEALFQSTVLPLGRMLQLLGAPGSCKSAFLFELARWMRLYSGITFLEETEDKFSATLCQSIVGYDDPYAVGIERCTSVDQWQSRTQHHVNEAHKLMGGTGKTNPGVGYRFPVMIAVDSIMGVPMQEKSDRIELSGHAGRDHPVEALSISAFLKKFHSDIGPYPFLFAFTNHLKAAKDDMGRRDRRRAGGESITFHETLELEMAKIGAIQSTKISGSSLMISCYKNCVGDTGRRITVDIKWKKYKDEATGQLLQNTWFDWDAATTNMLLLAGGDKYKYISADVRKTAGLVKAQKGKFVHSSRLGIPKDSPVSYAEAGALIHKDEELMEELRDQLGIMRFREISHEFDYVKERAKLRAELAEASKEA